MSGKSEKAKRRTGLKVSIAARRGQREFGRQVHSYLEQRAERRAVERKALRTVLAVAALAVFLAAALAVIMDAIAAALR